MIDTLYPVSRLLIRASLALFTCVVLVLIQSAFWSARVSAWMQAIIFAIALLSYFRPHYGSIRARGAGPAGASRQPHSRLPNARRRSARPGVSRRRACTRMDPPRVSHVPLNSPPRRRADFRIRRSGFLYGADLAQRRSRCDFAWPFLQEVLTYASRNYLTSFRGFGSLFRAMLLLEGLALLIYVARYTRERPEFGQRLAVMIVAGAVGTAMLTVWHVSAELIGTGVRQARHWSIFFARSAMERLISAMSMPPDHFSRWECSSRVGNGTSEESTSVRVDCGGVSPCGDNVDDAFPNGNRRGAARCLLCLAAAACFGGPARRAESRSHRGGRVNRLGWSRRGTISAPSISDAEPPVAVRIRWLFLGTTWRMLVAEPLFGLGIGQYLLVVRHISRRPRCSCITERENAHNNFAQIAGELGIVGFISFVAVLVAALMAPRAEERRDPDVAMPVLLGACGVHPHMAGRTPAARR